MYSVRSHLDYFMLRFSYDGGVDMNNLIQTTVNFLIQVWDIKMNL